MAIIFDRLVIVKIISHKGELMRNKSKIIVLVIAIFLIGVLALTYAFTRGSNNNPPGKTPNVVQDDRNKINMDNPQLDNPGQQMGMNKDENQNGNEQQGNNGDKKEVKKVKAKAIYITGSSAGSAKRLDHIIELINTTELNAVVIDVKDDFGKVNYLSDIEGVRNSGAYHKLYNAEEVLKKLHDNGVYVIGRIVTFKDPLLAEKRPDLAIKKPDGQIWREGGKTAWANPYNKEVWKYNIEIAREAADKGFDEIQFDYVRYPAARKADVYFGENIPTKAETICSFLKTAHTELHEKKGVVVSADVFGIICESPGDFENIGQSLEMIGMDIDYICPMIYPSHYANEAQNGVGQTINGVKFPAPDLKPYEVVYNTLSKARERISKVDGYKANLRPYLQDFTASWLKKGYYQNYGADQVRQQIKAVYDAGYEEWIIWDPLNTYSEDAFIKEN